MKRMIVALAIAFSAASPALAQLPNLITVRTVGNDGKVGLAGWRTTTPPKSADVLRYSLHIEPSDKAFLGARTFVASLHDADAVSAAKKAAAAEGFETTKVLAQAKVKQAVVERLEKGGKVTAVMLEGRMAGKPARFIGHVWYGASGEPDGKAASGVHGFVAPEPAFVALGGYAIPAILFLGATATPGSNMSEDGSVPPQEATTKLADLFAQWAATLSNDNISALNGIMNGNLGVKSGTGCINTFGCVGGGLPPIRTPNN